MFTGIVQALQPVVTIVDKEGGRRLTVTLGPLGDSLAQNVHMGASIAINGACLTVAGIVEKGGELLVEFDVMQETLEKTNLGGIKEGDRVDVERCCAKLQQRCGVVAETAGSLKMGDELGGHQVSGHIDTTATISKIDVTPNNCEVFFSFADPEKWMPYIVPKGYIAIDGASLTIVKVGPDYLSVCLIPETLARTTLGIKAVGSRVNIELEHGTKVLVKTLEAMLPRLIGDYLTQNPGVLQGSR